MSLRDMRDVFISVIVLCCDCVAAFLIFMAIFSVSPWWFLAVPFAITPIVITMSIIANRVVFGRWFTTEIR